MDPVHFSTEEVLNMAVRIEVNGKGFYTKAAEVSASNELKELFTFLAKEEDGHIEFFSSLLNSIDKDEKFDLNDPYFDDVGLYLNALADSSVFTSAQNAGELAASNGPDEALKFAIAMEKDSILFYYELKNMVVDKDKKLVDAIIEEERKHVTRLTEAKDKL